MRSFTVKKIFLLTFIITAISLTANTGSKEHKLSDVDLNFTITIPDKAKYTSKKNEHGALSYIEVRMPDKSVFMLSLHPMKKGRSDTNSLMPILIERGELVAGESEEGKLKLLELKREDKVVGNYYSLTDKQPKEGEFKYLSQGAVDYNFVLGTFTYLTNDKKTWASFGGIDPVSIINDSIRDKVTKNFEKIKLTKEELSKFEPSIIENFYSRQQVILYENTDIYKEILSNLKEKHAQSFNNDKEECTIFYYYFTKKLEKNQEAFLTGLFYGDTGKPSDKNPETFLIKDNYLIVFSFPRNSKLHKEISDLIAEKLKGKK